MKPPEKDILDELRPHWLGGLLFYSLCLFAGPPGWLFGVAYFVYDQFTKKPKHGPEVGKEIVSSWDPKWRAKP